jgi:hypothetical protein
VRCVRHPRHPCRGPSQGRSRDGRAAVHRLRPDPPVSHLRRGFARGPSDP